MVAGTPSSAVIQAPRNRPPLTVDIIDFSPEWDYTTGGSKVMVCIRQGIEGVLDDADFEHNFECSFGDSVVPV